MNQLGYLVHFMVKVEASGSPNFPYRISDTNAEIFGLVARLMDHKRVDGMSSFAVTPQTDGFFWLWLDKASKEYLIG